MARHEFYFYTLTYKILTSDLLTFVSWNDESYGLFQSEINALHFIWQCLPSSNTTLKTFSERCFICFVSSVF